MKSRNLILMFASVFAVIFLVGLVSASVSFNGLPTELSQSSGSFKINLTNTNTTSSVTISSIIFSPISQDGSNITFSASNPGIISANSSVVISVSYIVPQGFEFRLGNEYSTIITVKDGKNNSYPSPVLKIKSTEFCSNGNQGNLEIKNVDVTNLGEGKNDVWNHLDEIQIDVEVKNTDSDIDIRDVMVDLVIMNSDGIDVTSDFELEEETIDLGKISSRDSDTATFVIPRLDVNLKEGDYKIFVKAYQDNNEGSICIDDSSKLSDDGTYEAVEVKIERSFLIGDISFPETTFCGSTIDLLGTIYNLDEEGESDVMLNLYNNELGIDSDFKFGNDLESVGDDAGFDFVFKVPIDAKEKTYPISLNVLYDYKKTSDVYRKTVDNVQKISLKVEGNCIVIPTAKVDSTKTSIVEGGKAGEKLIVNTVISNTGDEIKTYVLNVSGNEDWSSNVKLNKESLTLNPGESSDLTLTFDTYKNASGEETFDLSVVSGEDITEQPVSVEIQKAGFFAKLDWKWYIWVIIGVNAILLILIITVLVRLLRKK